MRSMIYVMLQAAVLAGVTRHSASTVPYKNKSLSVMERTQDLLDRMTVEEKVGQLLNPYCMGVPTCCQCQPNQVYDQYKNTTLGAWFMANLLPTNLLEDGSTPPKMTSPAQLVHARNVLQKQFVEHTRLGIPTSFVMETLHSGAPGGTIFPAPANFGTAWNTSALKDAAKVQAAEARAVGADRGLSPVVNLFPDPRFGRAQEGFGEDPHVTAMMGAAHLSGLQGGSTGGPETYLPNYTHSLVATVKHYAAYGHGPIDGSPSEVSDRLLREYYLKPWRYLASKGLRSAMAGQNMVNGRPMHSNKWLISEVLRKEYDVPRLLMSSDGGDVVGALRYGFHTTSTVVGAATASLTAGMDTDIGGVAFPSLAVAVNNGTLAESEVDRATINVLASKFAAGLFDQPYTDETKVTEVLDAAASRQLSKEVAEQSFVLLINRNSTLPLNFPSLKGKTVALVGALANSTKALHGAYANPGTELFQDFEEGARLVTPNVALKAELSKHGASMTYTVGATPTTTAGGSSDAMRKAAVNAVKGAAVAVVVVGDLDHETCGETTDRSSLELAGGQLALIEAVTATGIPTIVLLLNGRPTTFGSGNAALDGVSAFIVGWAPGEEGGPAFVNILSGNANPSGRLTQNWPRSVGGVGGPGAPYLYPWAGEEQGETYAAGDGVSSPLFTFGSGLSYTKFTLSKFGPTGCAVGDDDDGGIDLSDGGDGNGGNGDGNDGDTNDGDTNGGDTNDGDGGNCDACGTVFASASPSTPPASTSGDNGAGAGSAATTLQLEVTITNSGKVDGATPVQLFFRYLVSSPVRIASIQLLQFTKAFLRAGETKRLLFQLKASDFEFWDDGRNGNPNVGLGGGWAVASGEVELIVSTDGYGGWDTPNGIKTTIKVVA